MGELGSSADARSADRLNERRLWVLLGVIELCWLAGLTYVLTVIL